MTAGTNLLYWLLYQKGFLVLHIGPFRIFRYLTFRTAFASLTAFFIGLVIGPAVIHRLREFQIGQYIREDGPKAIRRRPARPPWAAYSSSLPTSCPRCCGLT